MVNKKSVSYTMYDTRKRKGDKTMNQHYPFELPPLNYRYNDLEPYISGEIIRIHHNVLMQSYVDKLNDTLSHFPQYQSWSLKNLVAYSNTFPPALRKNIENYAGGLYNHYIYFNSMTPNGRTPTHQLMTQIKNSFGTFDNMKKAIQNSANKNFGCGYTWLVCNKNCNLQIINTQRQNTPPLTLVSPIITIDLWEHAFFPQYINNRSEYVLNWMKIADWNKVCEYTACSLPAKI